MDYNRKIGKQKDEIWGCTRKNQDLIPLKSFGKQKSEEIFKEDHRLVNWKRWLADRENRQKRLTISLKRKPLDLVLNAHEKVRSKNEKKIFVEAAGKTEITNQDKFRGNPAFWKIDEHLKSNCEDSDSDDVTVSFDRESKFLPPNVTRVGLPDYIKKEKMLVESFLDPTNVCLKTKWDSGDYLKRRTKELQREIKFLEPKEPETKDLIIIGQKLEQREPEVIIRIPIITITNAETKKKLLSDPEDRVSLKIQDRQFVLEKTKYFERLSSEETKKLRLTKEDLNEKKYIYAIYENDCVYKILSKNSNPITWSLNFQTTNDEICKRKFIFENTGTYVINVDWREETKKCSCIPIPERVKSYFFFDKNRLRILPGQKIEFSIWFRSNCPIIASETWKLVIHPKVYPGTIYLRLWATSQNQNRKSKFKKQSDDIKLYLQGRVRNSVVREIINNLLITSTNERYSEDIPYDMFFLEREIFEARNPGFHYDSLRVEEFKIMFKETANTEWNLSLKNLRSILLKTQNSNIARFRQICDESLRPINNYNQTVSSKMKFIYWLLCTFINQFEDESNFILNKCCSKDINENLDEDEEYEDEMSISEIQITEGNLQVYKEVFYVRIRCLLEDTIDRICIACECCDNFQRNEF